MQPRSIFLIASLTLLAACGDKDPTGTSGLSGTMTFNYTGGGSGTFNVSGTMPTTAANVGTVNWAAGNRDTPNTQLGVAGARARTGGRYDLAVIGISRLTVGSESIDADCDPDLGENCSGVVLLINISEADEDFDFICVLTTGSLAITSISDSRAEGTFTGSGTCINDNFVDSPFSISNGTFNVALVPNFPI